MLIIEDDMLFYPAFVRQVMAQSPIAVVGLVVARARLKHNRYLHTLKRLRYFRPVEIVKLLWWHLSLMGTPSIAQIAQAQNIPVITAHGSVNTPEMLAWIDDKQPTVLFSASPLIVGKSLLASVRLAVNMHFSKLPAYKGIMPVFHTMAHGEKEGAISLHEMTEKIDEGAVLYQHPVPLDYQKSLIENYKIFFAKAGDCVIEFLTQVKQEEKVAAIETTGEPSYFKHPDANDWQRFRAQQVPFI